MLAEDQLKAVKEIKNWWKGNKAFHILDGSAGVGKSYVVDTLLKQLPKVEPLLLAPTHKALRQLKEKTPEDYKFATVASSLGIRPIDEGKGLDFKHIKLPTLWEFYNLAVVDEASMLDTYHLDLFKSIGIKILYVGHKSQLPPVRPSRSMFDKCISPVFEQGYDESHLYIPKRNTGTLWEFNETIEQGIYDKEVVIPNTFDIGGKDFKEYMNAESTLKSLGQGDTKVALWTREGVGKYNRRIKDLLFPNATSLPFEVGELVIVKNSIISFDGMERFNDERILKHTSIGTDIYTDTDGRVLACKEVTVHLNKYLSVQCYKLLLYTAIEGTITVYGLADQRDYKRIADYYEHLAWAAVTKPAKDKLYRERSLILKCFAQVQSFYAATCHSLQGSSIPNVVAILADINKNSNRIERTKCTYVACSRASVDLKVYRGLS